VTFNEVSRNTGSTKKPAFYCPVLLSEGYPSNAPRSYAEFKHLFGFKLLALCRYEFYSTPTAVFPLENPNSSVIILS